MTTIRLAVFALAIILLAIALPAQETTYNALGTQSGSEIGLVSTRRADPEFPGFLLGIQGVAMQSYGKPLNVAPMTAVSIAEQADYLEANNGVKVFVVDAPDPEDAREFFAAAAESGRRATLIAQAMPRGFFPPAVVESPSFYGEVLAEESIRRVGNVSARVAVVNGDRYSSAAEGTPDQQTWKTFRRVFDHVAPKLEVVSIDPLAHEPGFTVPAVVVALSREEALEHATALRAQYPDAKIVLPGESDALRAVFARGAFDVRVRPDYFRLLSNALREERHRSEYPIILRPIGELREGN